LAAYWTGVDGLGALDAKGVALVSPVWFPGVGHPVTVLALTHPSLRHLNLARRHYHDLSGDEAELALLHEALSPAPTESA
jgi:hypothetical protein